MQLLASEFNAFLRDMGQAVAWRQAFACPCVNPNSGQAKQSCPHCLGKGSSWGEPIDATVGVAGRSTQKTWAQFGIWDTGDVVLSIPSDSPVYAIGRNDRVMFLNRSEPFSINLVKGVNERIRFSVISITSVRWIDGTALKEVTPPVVNDDGSLDWSAVQIPDGATISVTGRRRTEFFCFHEMPFDRPHHHGEPLPRSVVLRRFDLFGNHG